jgi:hypothetical protein
VNPLWQLVPRRRLPGLLASLARRKAARWWRESEYRGPCMRSAAAVLVAAAMITACGFAAVSSGQAGPCRVRLAQGNPPRYTMHYVHVCGKRQP